MKKIESELYTMFAAQPVEKTLPPALIEAAEKNAKKRKRHWRALAASAVSFVLVLVVSLYAGLVVFAPANNKGEEQGSQYERVGYDASLSYGLAPAEWEYALKSSDRGLLFSLAENDGKFYFSHLSYDWYFDGEGLQGELENFLKEGNV